MAPRFHLTRKHKYILTIVISACFFFGELGGMYMLSLYHPISPRCLSWTRRNMIDANLLPQLASRPSLWLWWPMPFTMYVADFSIS